MFALLAAHEISQSELKMKYAFIFTFSTEPLLSIA